MNMTGIDKLLDKFSDMLSEEEFVAGSLKGVIAATITIKRMELGISQKDLAAKIGVSQGLVSRWEKGETNFTIETLVRIADVLSIEIQCPYVMELKKPVSTYFEKKRKPRKYQTDIITNASYVNEPNSVG